ncbi:MAG: FHA domain-containing protein, partial [Myxococcales bacterium]|nr:FHA domain-containing protein [Myxococcales bacterium]
MTRGLPPLPEGTLTDIRANVVELPNLRVVLTPAKGKKIEAPIGVSPLVIGSDPDCDVLVTDPRVSRKHCEIRREGRAVIIKDLGSKNGTFIDRVPIREAYLEQKMVVVIGDARLVLEAPRGSA